MAVKPLKKFGNIPGKLRPESAKKITRLANAAQTVSDMRLNKPWDKNHPALRLSLAAAVVNLIEIKNELISAEQIRYLGSYPKQA